jgi:hypothetical protein
VVHLLVFSQKYTFLLKLVVMFLTVHVRVPVLGGGGLHTYVHVLRDGVCYDMGAEYASRAHVQCCHGLGGLIWDNFSIEQSYIH